MRVKNGTGVLNYYHYGTTVNHSLLKFLHKTVLALYRSSESVSFF